MLVNEKRRSLHLYGEAGMIRKTVYTTGEAAEICNLSLQTVIRCFDNGQLKGFRVPGSKFRRIPHESLVTFMRENNIPADAFQSDKIKVLVVDDDPDILEILVEYLKSDGRFDVHTARTGFDAGVLTQKLEPAIVILDYMLPDLNGNIVCRTIRENPHLAHIKILIISGMVKPEEIDMLMEAGADDFIKKPFNIESVVDRVLKLVNA